MGSRGAVMAAFAITVCILGKSGFKRASRPAPARRSDRPAGSTRLAIGAPNVGRIGMKHFTLYLFYMLN